ncbi:MAG: hypothetical protein KHX40_12215 [Oscillospiraceae bacterium]|nr:hypothetical protein [Oscillospiraceae bacterium]
MSISEQWLLDHSKHFHWNRTAFERIIEESEDNDVLFSGFHALWKAKAVFYKSPLMKNLGEKEILQDALDATCDFVRTNTVCELSPLLINVGSYKILEKICFFKTLCTFLHTSTRIKGKSYSAFLYEHSPLHFNDYQSPNYRFRFPSIFDSEVDAYRKSRIRHLHKGKVYIQRDQWSAVTRDLEHELSFRFRVAESSNDDSSADVRDIYKRMENLYQDVDRALDADESNEYPSNLLAAYKKFQSKLNKLEYSKYLELQKLAVSHLLDNKEYYGINLYRLERTMSPYGVTNEVKHLLACQSDNDEEYFLAKTIILRDVHFPIIYESLLPLHLDALEFCVDDFLLFLRKVVVLSCLLIDGLIERGIFSDNWAELFRSISNEMAEDVLYDPNKIDLSFTEVAQEKFKKLLNAPVYAIIQQELEASTQS